MEQLDAGKNIFGKIRQLIENSKRGDCARTECTIELDSFAPACRIG